ncbi:scaffolding protein [Robertmurraya sp. DFI.2.37]|uniref:scaffolding protein n=1 Tax=Robertmurraya sp. DFI.2.37 TaxID=3031819 RepID=UPI001CD943A0|nr:scaffolding protein [Robertmurraya sp. DFI.2.37]MDF1510590.1 scaffolding protein [Robertmurraya sp. DFI.2.37]
MKRIISYIRLFFVSIWLLFAKDKKEVKSFKATSPLRFDLQFFADGGDGGDGGGDDGGDGKGDDKTFTQEDVNKMIKDRLPRAEKKAQEALAKQLGYESVEAMTAALNKDKDKDKDKKTDPVDVDALLEAKLKEEREKTFTRLRNSEVKVQAKELDFADWEDALALADLSEVKEDDKGNIIGVKEALEELAKKKPHLLKQQGANGTFGASIPNNQQRQKESLEDIKKLASTRGAQTTTAHNPWA